jgi:CBS domain-containing protein
MQPVIVHRQRIVDGKGRERVDEVVSCPRLGALRCAQACLSCGHGGPSRFDEDLVAEVIDCDVRPGTTVSTDELHSKPIQAVLAGEVCTRDIICAEMDAPIRALLRIFDEHAIAAVPILDHEGAVVGIVSPGDLSLAPDARSAADVMTRDPVQLLESTPITRAAAVMAFEGILHLPVVGWGGRVVGVLSPIDIVRFIVRSDCSVSASETPSERTHASD